MNAFAGFWVDGAVRKPDEHCFDGDGLIHIKWKHDFPDFDIATTKFSPWSEVYWLDTTPRKSLTPEELLALAMVLWPDIATIYKHEDVWYSDCQGKESSNHIKIDWGNLTQCPPPSEPQWVRVTRENVGQYLFRECRFRDVDTQEWRNGKVSGWDVQDNCCLVHSNFEEEIPIMNWCIVEVQA